MSCAGSERDLRRAPPIDWDPSSDRSPHLRAPLRTPFRVPERYPERPEFSCIAYAVLLVRVVSFQYISERLLPVGAICDKPSPFIGPVRCHTPPFAWNLSKESDLGPPS